MLPPPELGGVRHRHIQLPTGVRAHVAEAGPEDAPAVLCLHGWPQNWWMWRRVIPLLAGDFRLVAPDMRGFGWSGFPADGDFAKDRLADDALAVLDALELERAHLLGHDWGAWTGLLIGLRAPERVDSLLALGIMHPWQPRLRMLLNGWRFAYAVPLAAGLVRGPVVHVALRGGWGDGSSWDEDAARVFAATVSARATAGLYGTFLTRELPAIAVDRFEGRRLTVPTRLIIGSRDPVGAGLAAGIERHGDDAAAEVLDGCGHFIAEERPAVVADRARALFTGR